MQRKLGLVLEGGGAKGAFSFGVIKAFHAAGWTFRIVAGTSVGALNAVILATDNVAKGEEVWRTLGFEKVFRPNYPRGLAWLAMPLIYLTQILLSLFGPPIPGSGLKWVKFCLALVLVSPVGFGIWIQRGESVWAQTLSSVIALAASSLLAYALATKHSDSSPGAQRGWLWLGLTGLAGLGFCATVVLGRWGAYGAIAIGALLFVVYRVVRATTHDSSPLRTMLQQFLSCELKTLVYVTSARKQTIWIPDEMDGVLRTVAGASIPERSCYNEYVPIYHNLNDLEVPDRVLAALASASLPLGLVKGVVIDSAKHIDGGVVDNCPLYPVLNAELCTDIVVVHLSTSIEYQEELPWSRSRTDDGFPMHGIQSDGEVYLLWARFNRLDHIIKYCESHPDAFYEGRAATFVFRPSGPHPKLPGAKRIHHLFPDTSLGGFLSGTLNFSPKRACDLIAAGEAKGRALVAQLESAWAREEHGSARDIGALTLEDLRGLTPRTPFEMNRTTQTTDMAATASQQTAQPRAPEN